MSARALGVPGYSQSRLPALREIGSHHELLAHRGINWKLYQLQFGAAIGFLGAAQAKYTISGHADLGRNPHATP